ncbi:hypothetical protein ACS0TY_018276 [Phlomoides rotata]
MAALSDNEDETINLGFHDSGENRGGNPFCLTGRLYTSKPFNVFTLIDVMLKGFKVKGKVSAWEWGKSLLIFSFTDHDDREWVLQNQPWHFEGNLFAVTPLSGSEQPSLVKVSRASFWARLYDLSMVCHNESTLKTLARRIIDLEAFDPPINNLGSFLRFKIGHNFKFCDYYDRNDCQAPTDLDFGPNMKASPLRRARGQKLDVLYYGLGSSSTASDSAIAKKSIPSGSSLKPTLNHPEATKPLTTTPTEQPSIQNNSSTQKSIDVLSDSLSAKFTVAGKSDSSRSSLSENSTIPSNTTTETPNTGTVKRT